VRVNRGVEQVTRDRHDVVVRRDALALLELDVALEQLPAQRVDVLPLLVHHVVVLEQVLADGEVLRFDLALGALDRPGDHLVLDGHALFHAQPLHQSRDAIRAEDAHQVSSSDR